MRQNRDEAVRVALDLQKKDLTNSLKRDFDKDLARLEGEVLSLKQVSMMRRLIEAAAVDRPAAFLTRYLFSQRDVE